MKGNTTVKIFISILAISLISEIASSEAEEGKIVNEASTPTSEELDKSYKEREELEFDLESNVGGVNALFEELEELMQNEDVKKILAKENDENASEEEKEVARKLRRDHEKAKKNLMEMTRSLEDLEINDDKIASVGEEDNNKQASGDMERDMKEIDDL